VHPDVLERDGTFRNQSLDSELLFGNMDKGELERMHVTFVQAFGGTVSSAEKDDPWPQK